MVDSEQEAERAPSSMRTKKPYSPPLLSRLGTLQELTLAVGYRGNSDGGRFPRGFKTSY